MNISWNLSLLLEKYCVMRCPSIKREISQTVVVNQFGCLEAFSVEGEVMWSQRQRRKEKGKGKKLEKGDRKKQ